MFDFSFSELLLIGIVALVVIGPERLPKVARTAGHLFGRMQRYVADVKADINREMHVEELKQLQEEMRASANSLEKSVAQEVHQGSQELQAVSQQIHEIVEISRDEAAHEQSVAEEPPAQVAEATQSQLELNLEPADKPAAPHKNT